MKIFTKIILWTLVLALYLNIGWGLSYYSDNYIDGCEYSELSLTGKFLVGPGAIVQNDSSKEWSSFDYFIISIIWVFNIFAVLVLWLFYGIYLLAWLIFGGVLKIIFL